MKYSVQCARCGAWVLKEGSALGRAERSGSPIYCDRVCAGLARRDPNPPTKAERCAAKSAYDAERREKLADRLKAERRAYHLRTYDPSKAAAERKRKMPRHVEYCRRPEYRAKKAVYDRQRRAEQQYGEFADAFLLVQDLDAEVGSRITRYEIYANNGTLNKKLNRRRDYEKAFGR